MDLSTAKWLSELEANDPSFLQHWVNKTICCDPPQPHVNNIISFGESITTMDQVMMIKSETDVDMIKSETDGSPPLLQVEYSVKGTSTGGAGGGVNRTPLQAQDHVLAERKRRQKLTQQFIALSAIVPGLNKLDKASVLGGAIKYLKELEEKQQALEVETKRIQHQDSSSSVVSSKRPSPSSPNSSDDHDTSSSSGVDFEGSPDVQDRRSSSSPEIQIRISGDNVLIRIYCCNINGIMNEMLREIEKLPISVISSNAMPFGNTTLCVTIIAKVDGDSGITAQELTRNIREVVAKLV